MNNNPKHRLRLTRRPKEFKEVSLYPIIPPSERTVSIHFDLLITAAPLLLFSVYHYGFRPITLTLISVLAMIGLDIALKAILKKEAKFDISPAVSGVLIALFLPASAPMWLPILTAIFATVIKAFLDDKPSLSFSPVAISVLAAFVLFPSVMNVIPQSKEALDPFAFSVGSFKAISASPLEKVLAGHLPDTTAFETFFGLASARIGEISGLLLVIALIYLSARKAVKLTLPLTYILTVGFFAYLFPSLEAASDSIALDGSIYNVFDSNTFLVAVFLLSEPKRSARSPLGTVICGLVGGLITMLLRGHIAVGLTALIAVIVVDAALPIVNKFMKTAPFGGNIAPQKEDKNG